jgi:hypothetical protein
MDKEKIYNAFPQILRNDVRAVLTVLPPENNLLLSEGQFHTMSDLIHPDAQEVVLDGELLRIPTRIYFNEPDPHEQSTLNELQNTIVNCIYLRHHNGFIRQRRLSMLTSKIYYFIVPYAFQLLGEYIIEIIGNMDDFIDETNIHLFRRFLSENREYWTLTKARMISYWNEYYRTGGNRNIRDYIGKKVFDKLENTHYR